MESNNKGSIPRKIKENKPKGTIHHVNLTNGKKQKEKFMQKHFITKKTIEKVLSTSFVFGSPHQIKHERIQVIIARSLYFSIMTTAFNLIFAICLFLLMDKLYSKEVGASNICEFFMQDCTDNVNVVVNFHNFKEPRKYSVIIFES